MTRNLYPSILPIAGGLIGIAIALSYYLSLMISQLIIGRPSSTWILGLFWLPFFVLKPGLVGLLIGSFAWLLIRPFHLPRLLSLSEIKVFKMVLALSMITATVIGFIKILILK